MALMLRTASASRGPTVMVLVVGVIASTKRGSPSGAGVPSRRPRRCPTVNRCEPACSPTFAPVMSTMSPGLMAEPLLQKSALCPRSQ